LGTLDALHLSTAAAGPRRTSRPGVRHS
jgi:hypothetical protein